MFFRPGLAVSSGRINQFSYEYGQIRFVSGVLTFLVVVVKVSKRILLYFRIFMLLMLLK